MNPYFKVFMMGKVDGIKAKKGIERITALTAYDYPTALLVDEAGFDIILVGDSLGVVVLGYENTLSVTMEDMLHHTKAVTRGTKNALVIGDMPVQSYDTPEMALRNAKSFLEAGAEAVKTEGAVVDVVEAVVGEGIPVMGHLGLTPQTITDYKVQGRNDESAARVLREALSLADAGIFALVLECVPEDLGRRVTEELSIPTIGIGAGRYCDGQILVINDLLGLFDRYLPKFAKRYVNMRGEMRKGLLRFKEDVVSGRFPGEENVYK
ncbi:MAG: 3-methyl-2-oxobutanoate hydroxymethyltransferase [Candidatus Hydrothermarchaeaceae archaeon]